MRISLAGVVKAFGAHTVLDRVDLTLGPHSRLGLVGRNGAGKTTLLRLLAGLEQPDDGRVERSPAALTVGYLPQEHDRRPGETLLAYLARRTGVAEAEAALERHSSEWEPNGYSAALERFTALGGGDLEARARTLCADLGLSVPLEQETATLSGGEAARAALAAILLSRFDVLLLDEPTNDLDFDGLDRLERFLDAYEGGLAVVSHDRAFLDRTVTRIAEIDPWTQAVAEFAGGWSEYAAQRDEARRASTWALRAGAAAPPRADHPADDAAHRGARWVPAWRQATGGPDRRATHALRDKVRQAEKLARAQRAARQALPAVGAAARAAAPAQRLGDLVLRLDGAVARRGAFRLGPIDLDLAPGRAPRRHGPERQRQVDAAGAPPRRARARRRQRARSAARRCSASLEQATRLAGEAPLLERSSRATGLSPDDARTLLAKFGLGAGARAAADAIALAGRADARPPRRASGARRQLPRARRADEPPRPRGCRGARGGPRRLRGHGRRRLARPRASSSASRRPGRSRSNSARLAQPLDGSPQEENLEGTPRQAPRAARHRGAARERVPDLPSAEAAAPRLPDVQDVQGPRGRAAPHAASVAAWPESPSTRWAATARPDEIVAGALEAASRRRRRRSCSGRAASTPAGSSSSRRPRRSRWTRSRPTPCARSPTPRSSRRCRAVADGQRRRRRLGREHGRDARRRARPHAPAARRDAPGDRRPDPDAARARPSCSTPARTRTPGRSTCSSSRTWAPSSPRRSSSSPNPEVRLLSIGEEPEKGNQLTLEAHALLAESELDFARQRREPRPARAAPPTSSSATASPATSR